MDPLDSQNRFLSNFHIPVAVQAAVTERSGEQLPSAGMRMRVTHSKDTGCIGWRKARIEVRLQEPGTNLVYLSYACYIRNCGLVRRDPYNAAIALVKFVYVEDSFS
jgi:hypothetical protein